jgi:DNA processing protein
MTPDLFQASAVRPDLLARAISPRRELGAYEALWAKEGTWFKSIADDFRAHQDAVPSDFVSEADIEKYARLALGAIRAAGIQHFGVRIHGAGEYPQKLRDAEHPVELLYFQGLWDLVNTRCVAVVGARSQRRGSRAGGPGRKTSGR